MSKLQRNVRNAGKITILTSFVAVFVFAIVFLLNIGANELTKAEAQNVASTSVMVLNVPPNWTVDAEEEEQEPGIGSTATRPTNSGDEIAWLATATDNSDMPYFLIICSTSTEPVPDNADDYDSLGTAPPSCAEGSIQWAISPATPSGDQARAATTTTEDFPPFAEENDWYAWICDDDPLLPRCNSEFKQGTGDTASPFYVNRRPIFTTFTNTSDPDGVLPGEFVTFNSVSFDNDEVPVDDLVILYVCSSPLFDPASTTPCGVDNFIASSTPVLENASSTFYIDIPTQDQAYNAYGFIVDNHGHQAQGGAHGTNVPIIVANAPPSVYSSSIDLNDGQNITLTVPAGETEDFKLSFIVRDNNSCVVAGGDPTNPEDFEIQDVLVSVFRTDIGTTTCDGSGDFYDPNNCYSSGVGTSTWNIVCNASSTSCDGPTDTDTVFDCTFPLWHIADPSDSTGTNTPFISDWSAAVTAIDESGATSSHTMSDTGRNLNSFLAFALDTLAIAYGPLEPGSATDPLTATTTFLSAGNVGLDQLLSGESMCRDYAPGNPCPSSPESTIPESEQVFATSSMQYSDVVIAGNTLSSTTQKLLELNIAKNTSTSTLNSGVTYWGIRVPGTITFSGAYTGENTFWGAVSSPDRW